MTVLVKASNNLSDQTETGAIEKRAIKLEVLGRMRIIGGSLPNNEYMTI
jgi:hypothetical protein